MIKSQVKIPKIERLTEELRQLKRPLYKRLNFWIFIMGVCNLFDTHINTSFESRILALEVGKENLQFEKTQFTKEKENLITKAETCNKEHTNLFAKQADTKFQSPEVKYVYLTRNDFQSKEESFIPVGENRTPLARFASNESASLSSWLITSQQSVTLGNSDIVDLAGLNIGSTENTLLAFNSSSVGISKSLEDFLKNRNSSTLNLGEDVSSIDSKYFIGEGLRTQGSTAGSVLDTIDYPRTRDFSKPLLLREN